MQAFKNLIHSFGDQRNTQDITVDNEGYVVLSFDGQVLHIQFDEQLEEIILFTRLTEIDPIRAGDVCIMLLSANLFWQGGQGATFSIEPTTGIVFLAERQSLSLVSLHHLTSWLERFLNITAYWHQRLTSASGDSLNVEKNNARLRFNQFKLSGGG